MRRRVVVTGMGVVCPIGNSIEQFLNNLLEGKPGVGPITLFEPAELPTRIAAEVKWDGANSLRDRKIAFAVEATRQAMSCGRPQGEGGLSLGIGLELFSMPDLCAMRRDGFAMPSRRRDRLTFMQTPSDLCVHMISTEHRLLRPPMTHVSACAAGSDAIGTAFRMVADGRYEWMLAGGTDSMINPLGVGGFCRIGATTVANDQPERASRPFDLTRSGFVLGEGAGMLLMEPLESARERGATIYGEIAGYGNSFDAWGISEPHPEGRGAYQAMSRAVHDAGIALEEIDCINAHGTSTPKNDSVETVAIKRLLGERSHSVPVCATKSMIGHLISAAGAVEAIAALLCMRSGCLHPTINLENPDPLCDLDYVPLRARRFEHKVVLSNSFGFGGQNASIVLKAVHA
jgi:3-oxoacyl-[acyl-carrier-protein] synthase II